MTRSKRKEPTPPPGLAEFVAQYGNDVFKSDNDAVMEEYRKQWRDAHENGDSHAIPTQSSVGSALGVSSKTISGRVISLTKAGKMIRLGTSRCKVSYVPNEPEFTSALPSEEETR